MAQSHSRDYRDAREITGADAIFFLHLFRRHEHQSSCFPANRRLASAAAAASLRMHALPEASGTHPQRVEGNGFEVSINRRVSDHSLFCGFLCRTIFFAKKHLTNERNLYNINLELF